MSQIRNSPIQNGNIFTSMNVSLPPRLSYHAMTNFLSDIKISMMMMLRNIRFSGGQLYLLDVSNCSLTVMDVSVFGLEQPLYLDFSGNGFYELYEIFSRTPQLIPQLHKSRYNKCKQKY